MFESSSSPTTVFEVAPNSSGGEVFWIYHITEPDEFFSGCETEEEALEQLVNSERSPDEEVETCGYTLVLDQPEDPPADSPGTPPETTIVIEVIADAGQNRECEFYKIEDPVETFGDSWGNTPEMFDSIIEDGVEPMLSYDDVSLRFQRPYGAL